MLFLLACYQEVARTCGHEITTVDDDTPTDEGLTANRLIAGVQGTQSISVMDRTGATISLELALARTAEPVELDDATVEREVLSGSSGTKIVVSEDSDPCVDLLRVPMEASLQDPSGTLTLIADGRLTPSALGDTNRLTFQGDATAMTLPDGAHGPATAAWVWAAWNRQVLTELEVHAIAADGADEVVAVHVYE